ncbi:hypothetical protein [uncultured Hymenobacter sp.]|uniref:hypothetical protein n=1 Tax=uncultured Hymenobacter sp. TaxID=170016 RepID=UPI0035CC6EBE
MPVWQHASRTLKVWLRARSQTFFGALLGASLLVSCHDNETTARVVTPRPPVTGLHTTLLDTITNLPTGQIAWSTYWQLCWVPSPGAQAYELQTSTAEGTSLKLRRLTKPCYRLQLAAGRNARSQGLLNRKQLLDLQAGQLSFRVRAVFGPASFSEWSAPTLLQADTDPAASQ